MANGTKTEFIIIASNYRLKQLLGVPKIRMNQEVIMWFHCTILQIGIYIILKIEFDLLSKVTNIKCSKIVDNILSGCILRLQVLHSNIKTV